MESTPRVLLVHRRDDQELATRIAEMLEADVSQMVLDDLHHMDEAALLAALESHLADRHGAIFLLLEPVVDKRWDTGELPVMLDRIHGARGGAPPFIISIVESVDTELPPFLFSQPRRLSDEISQLRAIIDRWMIGPHDARPGVAQRALCGSLEEACDLESEAGEFSTARDLVARAIALRERLAAAAPEDSEAQIELADAIDRLGVIEEDSRNFALARYHLLRAREIVRARARSEPTNDEIQLKLVNRNECLAELERDAGELRVAREYRREVVESLRHLSAANHMSDEVRYRLTSALDELADLEQDVGNLSEALDLLIEVWELERMSTEPLSRYRGVVTVCWRLCDVRIELGKHERARPFLRTALESAEIFASVETCRPFIARDLATTHYYFARVEIEAANLDAAWEHAERAAEILSDAASEPYDGVFRGGRGDTRDLGMVRYQQGRIEYYAGDLEAAREHLRASLGLIDEAAADASSCCEIQRDLLHVLIKLGDVELALVNDDEARALYTRALRLAEGRAAAQPQSVRAKFDRSVAYERTCSLDRENVERWMKAVDALRECLMTDSANADFAHELGYVLYMIGRALCQRDDAFGRRMLVYADQVFGILRDQNTFRPIYSHLTESLVKDLVAAPEEKTRAKKATAKKKPAKKKTARNATAKKATAKKTTAKKPTKAGAS